MSCITYNASHQSGQFRDCEIFSYPNVQPFGRIVVLHQENSRVGQIIDVKKLPTRSASPPERYFGHARNLGFVKPTNQSGQDMRGFLVEVISRTVKVCWHEADRL